MLNLTYLTELYLLRATTILALLLFFLILWHRRRRRKTISLNLAIRSELSEIALDDAVEPEEDVWLAEARAIVHENLASPHFDVDYLAEQMGVSRTTLYRLMHEKAKMSPNQFIQEQRLLRACQLLESGQHDHLRQVADAVGFRSADYFSRLYRARFGTSPAEFFKKANGRA